MTSKETAGRQGKGEDGRARTREAKLAVFFTQNRLDKNGCPVRDRDSASVIATFEPASTFGNLVKAEGIRRGADHVRQLTIIGDGAAWIWGIATARFPEATQIVDLRVGQRRTGRVGGQVHRRAAVIAGLAESFPNLPGPDEHGGAGIRGPPAGAAGSRRLHPWSGSRGQGHPYSFTAAREPPQPAPPSTTARPTITERHTFHFPALYPERRPFSNTAVPDQGEVAR